MQSRTSLMAELEQASSAGPRDKAAMLTRVADLFMGLAPRCNDEQIDLFDDVFAHLTGEIEISALAELGRRLADCDKAPPQLMQQLAGDERIAVAGPVLARSVRLTETDLVDIARRASQPHLMAISARGRLTEQVTDVLVDRGDNKVLLSVATNAGAHFSAPGFAGLVRRAERDEELASSVLERADIPPALFGRLLIKATEVVRQRLMARAGLEPSRHARSARARGPRRVRGLGALLAEETGRRPKRASGQFCEAWRHSTGGKEGRHWERFKTSPICLATPTQR